MHEGLKQNFAVVIVHGSGAETIELGGMAGLLEFTVGISQAKQLRVIALAHTDTVDAAETATVSNKAS
jgi:hypothetical protein